jgi:hypothetical protein
MIALLVLRPLRLKNFAALKIGKHMVKRIDAIFDIEREIIGRPSTSVSQCAARASRSRIRS